MNIVVHGPTKPKLRSQGFILFKKMPAQKLVQWPQIGSGDCPERPSSITGDETDAGLDKSASKMSWWQAHGLTRRAGESAHGEKAATGGRQEMIKRAPKIPISKTGPTEERP